MKTKSPVVDLAGWLSPDEQRLLDIYRILPDLEQDDLLFRTTRQRLLPYLAADFDVEQDRRDETYLHEELEQWLREICPRTMLGDYLCEEPHFSALIGTAWDGAGRVLLGVSEHDGQRADELLDAALRLWDMVAPHPGIGRQLKFDRKAALAFIEAWREEVFAAVFRQD